MGLIVPAAMEALIRKADADSASLDEVTFAGAVTQAAPEPKTVTSDEWHGAFAEIAAWRFSRPHGGGDSEPWGLYWGPLASGTMSDGKPFYRPDVAEVGEDIVNHWLRRAKHLQHPLLRARYADLAWEIGRYLRKNPPDRPECAAPAISVDVPFAVAHVAIDGYLDAVERGLSGDEFESWSFLDRAISLALSLKDVERSRKAKAALFGYYNKLVSSGSKSFMWWRLNDLLEDREKALALDKVEAKIVTQSLEDALASKSDPAKEGFDPHQAMDAADRLVRRLGSNQEEVQRVTKQAAEAFEKIAGKASGLLAVSWLEDLIPRYRNAGLVDDAARIEQEIRRRAREARGEMKTISVPVQIPEAEMDKWADAIAGNSLKEGLGRIGYHCMMREDNTKQSLKDMVSQAPILAMMPSAIMSQDGFTEATVRSVDDDLEGRAIQHAANKFGWEAPFLYSALIRAKKKHAFDLDQLLAHIRTSPLFALSREGLLRAGLTAWFADDPVTAIHILVPQVEAACRDLLSALGGSVRKPNARTGGGGSRVIGLGEILSHQRFKTGVPKDVRFHLRAFYSDPRGINLRNHLAHGLASEGVLGMGSANWVVHSILMLVTLQIKRRPADGQPEPVSPDVPPKTPPQQDHSQ